MADLIRLLENKRIVIYGAGFVAEKFYRALFMRGLGGNVECFVVSGRDEERRELHGKPLISLDKFVNGEDALVCLAVHDVSRDEIEASLESRGILNRIWIRPYLFDLVLGKPVEKGVEMPVKVLVGQCTDYRIAVRYLAVEQYFKKNSLGYGIYVKAMGVYCGTATAEKRLEQFLRLIENWERRGYRRDSVILADRKGEIIDGAHRITLARYFDTDRVVCDIYQTSSDYYEWIGSGALLTRKKAAEAGFTAEETDRIEDAYQRIRER